jgi:hypothetical protein
LIGDIKKIISLVVSIGYRKKISAQNTTIIFTASCI